MNAVTGEGLPGGSIHLRVATSRGSLYHLQSDSDGAFAFDHLAQGSYVLSADRAGFLAANYGVRFLPAGQPIRLIGWHESRTIDFALMPRASISGRVCSAPRPASLSRQAARVEAWKWALVAAIRSANAAPGRSHTHR